MSDNHAAMTAVDTIDSPEPRPQRTRHAADQSQIAFIASCVMICSGLYAAVGMTLIRFSPLIVSKSLSLVMLRRWLFLQGTLFWFRGISVALTRRQKANMCTARTQWQSRAIMGTVSAVFACLSRLPCAPTVVASDRVCAAGGLRDDSIGQPVD